ncbi:AHH domain-containing protein [Croceicoccus gelatinilyticus]|uniref:AHH domain-containing protein n=1 Tax=Croceicoccus gelatinilyticus TaxID=2835536 RepID=UPI003080A47C
MPPSIAAITLSRRSCESVRAIQAGLLPPAGSVNHISAAMGIPVESDRVETALNARLPLHRGPHRVYNELVFERVGAVEMEWSHTRSRDELLARDVALARIRLIQRGLARGLERGGDGPFVLNRRDPIGRDKDYSELDAMADVLWGAVGSL